VSSGPQKKNVPPGVRRRNLVEGILAAGRESSAATVLLHTAIAERSGLTATDTKTIDTLMRLGPVTAGEIAGYTGLATASVTSLIDRLEKKKLVRRVRDARDRRRVIVEPVLPRIADCQNVFGPIREGFAELLENYGDEQLETILDFMRRSSQRARELTAAFTAHPTPLFRRVATRVRAREVRNR
jgi:DNA-binding MarR family transcriptional regulator